MEKVIEHFKKVLTCEQFIITGSYALKLYGLTSAVKDLDIIITKPSEGAIEVLQNLEIKKETDYPESKSRRFDIKFEEVDINIFIRPPVSDTLVLKDGIELAPIKGIIMYKKGYGRLKDFMQLKTIAELFFRKRDFNSFLRKEQSKFTPTPTRPRGLRKSKK